jgi:transcriptional regulator with XRE-family HTH domain
MDRRRKDSNMEHKIGEVAAEVRALMGRNRMTTRGLAKMLDVSEATASRRVNGLKPFTVTELFEIAEHFDVPITDLFGGARRHGSSGKPAGQLAAAVT